MVRASRTPRPFNTLRQKRLADSPRNLNEASNRQEHQPAIHRDPVTTDKDDHDEKIKILMTRIAQMKAPQPSLQGSGFMTLREHKRMAEDFIDPTFI